MGCRKLFCFFVSLFAAAFVVGAEAGEPDGKVNVLCTTFPVYQVSRNVLKGVDGVELGLMLPSGLGCPHDYALTPQDMKRLAKADILIVNGLGMEEFLGAPLKNANPNLKVVDSSSGIKGLLKMDAEEGHHHHHHGDVNPHLSASPRMSAKMALAIAEGLGREHPGIAAACKANAESYAKRLDAIGEDFSKAVSGLPKKRILTEHAVFEYLARDCGLEVVAVIEEHPGEEPSASFMIELVKRIRESKVGAIFTEPQYSAKTAEALSRETGVPVASLDPVATGPEDAPLGYYEDVMLKNIETLKKVLGK